MTSTGFQAIILCGPGESLNPFNSSPQDFPKALIPIANRPMVWYPLDWCYRMGVTNIHLITTSESLTALEAALSQNPYLTALPSPKPSVLAPPNLTLTTGTAEILRLPEVRDAIGGDFIVLPCDLVCELNGTALLETWMMMQSGLGGVAPSVVNSGLTSSGVRGGGLSVHYQTKNAADGPTVGVKKEETDFIATTEVPGPESRLPPVTGSLRPQVRNLAMAMPTAVLQDVVEEKKSLQIRHSLLKKRGLVKMLTTYRDAHVYFFPYWVLEMIIKNEAFDSLGEDVLGWWAKAGWQQGLAEKLSMDKVSQRKRRGSKMIIEPDLSNGIDLASLSSTWTSSVIVNGDASLTNQSTPNNGSPFASRVINPPQSSEINSATQPKNPFVPPPIFTYIHPAPSPSTPLIRRVDTVPLLLNVSLHLAKLNSRDDTSSSSTFSPLSHQSKVSSSTTIPQRCTVTRGDTLIDANVTVDEKTAIKESVVGANCSIRTGARLTRCLLMEGAVVDESAVISGCVLGRKAKVSKECELKDCTVQDGFIVPEGTSAKGEIFAGFDDGEGEILDDEFEDDDADAEGDDLYADA